jgi:hypothetical protein
MTEVFYEKCVEGHWYNPQINKTVDVYAITYEISQKPSREKILTLELLLDYKDAGDFDYFDEEKVEYEQGLPVYPQMQLGAAHRKQVTDMQ